MSALLGPWPWYVAGPLIGLMVPALLLTGGKLFGVSANLRHLCAACVPAGLPFLRYDWRTEGGWNLAFAAGIVLGGYLGGHLLGSTDTLAIAQSTERDLRLLGLEQFHGLVPAEVFSWGALLTVRGWIIIIGGGFLVGFGARYAGGCTSGHAITGLATLQLPSLIAVVGFFLGGLISTHVLLPWLL